MLIAGSIYRDMLSYAQSMGFDGLLVGDPPERLDVRRTRKTWDWPGTRLLSGSPPGEAHEFALTPDNVATLIESGLPQQFALLRGDGTVWMAANNNDVWFELDEHEFAATRGAVPGLLGP
jgi:hypothetical protein